MAMVEGAARLVPTTDRLLRGVLHGLASIDTEGRPDVVHTLGMAALALSHLVERQSPGAVQSLQTLEGEILALLAARGQVEQNNPPADYDTAVDRLTHAMDRLRRAVSQAADDHDFFARAEQMEARFYAALLPRSAEPDATPAPRLEAESFEAYLLAKFPGQYRRLAAFKRLVGGFQKDTILVEAELADGGAVPMVIRAEKDDRFVRFTASAITDEHAIVHLLWKRGVAVAEPLWLEADASMLGQRFMVSRRAVGGNTGSAYGNSAPFPDALTDSFISTLAQIHNQPLDEALLATRLGEWSGQVSLAENTRAEILAWRHQIWLRPAPASPSFARVFDWLEANVPPDDEPARVLHNDYGPHNILVDGDHVSAVLDWEIARIGDPAEDLSFFLQCAGSAIDREQALARYQALSGNRISRYRLAYFDVMSVAKVLVSTLSAAAMYQRTEPALIDWLQMPLLSHGLYQPLVEARIAQADALRGT
ncbi:phosphotransferase family protein [Novosphingobium sp. 9U]|uniref:phosphotransferase family protein n=1 Tax=Novosphingobium sp. 9U TaxID=2653158 RepID=UPI0012EEFAB6|nr:phosphotransferase family protein [Novosphingobium sp. 9U]VWX50207.1 Phosphotransferase family protein [Novosphingobium sp. 9U]